MTEKDKREQRRVELIYTLLNKECLEGKLPQAIEKEEDRKLLAQWIAKYFKLM